MIDAATSARESAGAATGSEALGSIMELDIALDMGGLTGVCPAEPGVLVGDAGEVIGPEVPGWPLSGLRLVLQPDAASIPARASANAPLPIRSFVCGLRMRSSCFYSWVEQGECLESRAVNYLVIELYAP
jgi:hypothetical protein